VAAAALAAALALWVGWGWFRDSPLVKVRHVDVSGATTADAPAIRRELHDAALRMTTLHVRKKELERAVSAYSIVHSISTSARFPSTLHIRVHQYVPVALLVPASGNSVPVASDGTLLPRVPKGKLPSVSVTAPPRRDGFESPRVRTLVRVLAGAPGALGARVDRAYLGGGGVLVAMRDGTTLEFGTPSRTAAKWASATRVLAAPSASGASTIDVRLPERPAASGFGGSPNAQVPGQNPQL
jgi:cell division septal protein FtsQ